MPLEYEASVTPPGDYLRIDGCHGEGGVVRDVKCRFGQVQVINRELKHDLVEY